VADARAKIVAELVDEFVEERVRQLPSKPFGVAEVKRALGTALKEAGGAIELKAGDDRWMAERLDGHPFLLRAKAGASWQPGLNKGALKRA
jgi:hypothetical protein